jgi:hypothetical protein
VSFHHRTVRERLVAHHVGEPEPVRGGRGKDALDEIGRPLHERCRVGGPAEVGGMDPADLELLALPRFDGQLDYAA